MTTNTESELAVATGVAARVLREGYGPGAWHGPDLRQALADVPRELAYWRPAPGRHNIVEIAVHHAYYVRSVRTRLTAEPVEPFPFDGDDWFEIGGERDIPWSDVLELLEQQQQRLGALIDAIERGTTASTLNAGERFDLVLGITCHAVYHAGQIQLVKRLHQA